MQSWKARRKGRIKGWHQNKAWSYLHEQSKQHNSKGLFPLERFAARFAQAMDIVAARSIGLKSSSMSIACEN
jgi:hypothetical protein